MRQERQSAMSGKRSKNPSGKKGGGGIWWLTKDTRKIAMTQNHKNRKANILYIREAKIEKKEKIWRTCLKKKEDSVLGPYSKGKVLIPRSLKKNRETREVA